MKPLFLNDIKKAIQVSPGEHNPIIKKVQNDIRVLGNQTVVFHLNKTVEVNLNQLSKFKELYIVTDQPILAEWLEFNDRFIFVNHLERSYKDFMDYYRKLFRIPVIAITGTNGKSTVKEMIAQVLRNKYKVVANKRSKNNPVFNHEHLLKIDEKTDYMVIETALAAPGHLVNTCSIFQPTIGIVTNIGVDHLEDCKTPNNYARSKGEMLAGLNYEGTLILNGDDPNINRLILTPYRGTILRFGFGEHNDYRGTNIKYTTNGMSFVLTVRSTSYPVFVPGFGEHTVLNALATLATLDVCGIDLYEAIHFLSSFKHLRSHLAIHKGPKGSTLIDDTWHINMNGVEAALNVIREIGRNKTKVAVFGRFDDLGKRSDHYYDILAKWLVTYEVDYLVTIDSEIETVGTKAITYGFNAKNHIHCLKREDIPKVLQRLSNDQTIILLKEAMYDTTLKQLLPQLIH